MLLPEVDMKLINEADVTSIWEAMISTIVPA